MLKKILSSIFILFFFFSAGFAKNISGEYVISNYKTEKTVKKSSTLNEDRANSIAYISNLRIKAGLWELSENSLLDTAALNHAKYLTLNNIIGHYENKDQYPNGFTGVTPSDRAHYVNYNGSVSENLSAGQNNVYDSVDNLFSAIYHRLGFLSINIDETGMGDSYSEGYAYKTVYVYNMGNSLIRKLCEQESFSGYGAYVYGVCIDFNKKISKDLYDNAVNTLSDKAPKYILWPFDGDNNTLPVFFEESPDPLPNCSVSGYPVTIQFNESKINSESFEFGGIKLYDSDGNLINSTLLTHDNDPNNHLSEYEFALMPLERLDWGAEYSVEATYTENGSIHTINWTFITQLPKYPYITVKDNEATVNIQSEKDYAIYLKPSDCNDKFSSYNYSYNGGIQSISASFIDSNTIHLNVKGSLGSVIEFTFSNGKKINFTISNSDNAVSTLKLKPETNVNISFSKGWSLKSLPVKNDNSEPITSFNNKNISTVWKWSKDKWKIWSPDTATTNLIKNYGISLINSISYGEGFWVNAKENTSINISSGEEYGIDNLTVDTGWTLLGTGKTTSLTEMEAKFADIKTLWKWNGSSWQIWSPNEQIKALIAQYGISSVTSIEKGEGFWVNK
jgi:uncharacterized protein YkwD